MNTDARELFAECFDTNEDEINIIFDYAENHGHIDMLYLDGTAVNMICQSVLNANGLDILYLFACCTKKEYRNKGLFRKQLDFVIGNKPAMLIPENESLVPMYEALGFSPIYHLEAEITGEGTAEEFDGSIDELYEIYKSSNPSPKKDFHFFESTVKAFLSDWGRILRYNGTVMLASLTRVTEIYAKSAQEAIVAAKHFRNGSYKVLLPLAFKHELEKQSIKHETKLLAMVKNINLQADEIHINNLFN